jgi:hypothetical protein
VAGGVLHAEFLHETDSFVLLLADGLLQLHDFVLEFPDLHLRIVLLLFEMAQLLLPLLLYLN